MELVDGMILAQDVRIMDGRMLVARGYEVNRTLRERIKNFSEKPGIKRTCQGDRSGKIRFWTAIERKAP